MVLAEESAMELLDGFGFSKRLESLHGYPERGLRFPSDPRHAGQRGAGLRTPRLEGSLHGVVGSPRGPFFPILGAGSAGAMGPDHAMEPAPRSF